jgi:hypothetical protein
MYRCKRLVFRIEGGYLFHAVFFLAPFGLNHRAALLRPPLARLSCCLTCGLLRGGLTPAGIEPCVEVIEPVADGPSSKVEKNWRQAIKPALR